MNRGIIRYILVSLLVLSLITPVLTTVEGSSVAVNLAHSKAYVSPVLLSDSFWRHGAYVEDPTLLSFTEPERDEFHILSDVETGRVLVVMDKNAPIGVLRGKVSGLVAALPTHLYNIVIAVITRDQLVKLGHTPGVLAILPDIRIDVLINKEQKIMNEVLSSDPLLAEVLQGSSSETGGYHYTVEITGAYDVWTDYNIRGENVKLAIIDTGVDYGSAGLGLETIARDEYGLPLIFDASSLGLVLTPVETTPTGDGYIVVNPEQLYVFYPPYYVFRWNASLWVRITGCRSFTGWVPFPSGNKWYVGNLTYYGTIKFGLMIQYISHSLATIYYTIPVIVVDSNGDSYYDTIYVDTSTALYLLRIALTPAPCSVVIPGTIGTTPDFSFADEIPVKYGNEVIARDLDGDGIRDYSIGALAGYLYDAAFAVVLDKMGYWRQYVIPLPPAYGYRTIDILNLWDPWRYEPVATIWPGLDPYGDYVVIEYDYHSHGTYCATTAAGRDYYAQTGYGVKSMSGQAPATKIAASPALYYGTVAVSMYFFSGFDILTPYGDGSVYIWPTLLANPWIAFEGWTWKWGYIGEHQVDITSNSYGASGWALWGWNTGADPTSVIYDYTIMTSGTMHFVAAGNGGPGYGTVASPAGSSLAISVGAATEFTYRPLYAYHWPGSSRQVISWSNRGPTEIGVVKPDLVAVGAFAWAVGRTWEALGARTLRGNVTHGLFSGTSQATPMTAGVGALVISAYKQLHGSMMPPYLLKTIMMNNAHDMGFDELSQGAGFVNAYKAVTALMDSSYPKVYSRDFFKDILSELSYNYDTLTFGGVVSGDWFEPKIFVPLVRTLTTRKLTIEGPGTYKIYSTRLEAVETKDICDVVLRVLDPTVITSCTGDSITFNVTAATLYGHLVLDMSALMKYDFFEIEVIYPFEYFERGGRTGAYNNTIPTNVLELAYWIDWRADDRFFWNETARIFYDIRGANALRIQIGDLKGQIEEIEYLARRYMGVDPTTLPRYLVMRLGVSGATYRGILPMRARVVGYQYKPWKEVMPFPSRVRVADSIDVTIIIKAPPRPGFYSGYVVVEEITRGFRTLIPVSFFVPIDFTKEQVVKLSPFAETTTRKNTYLRGTFDYTWRYESGDWRVFKVIVNPVLRNLWAIGVKITWPTHPNVTYTSNLDVHVYGPYTYYMVNEETLEVYEYRVNTVQLAAELSRDPRGGGGYNPTRFWDSYEPGLSMIITPITRPGVYRVIVRNIQFSGLDYSEPFTLELIPIIARTTLRYNTVLRGYEYIVNIRTPQPLLLPSMLNPTNDGIVYTVAGAYYIPSLSEYGIQVTLLSMSMDGGLTARILVKPTNAISPGTYIIPIEAVMQIPVTTVGWLTAGTPTVYFEWYSLPLVLRLVVR